MSLDTKSPVYVIGFAAVVSAVFTSGIVALQVATSARVELNQALREDRALLALFADAWGITNPADVADRDVVDLVARRIDRTRKVVDESVRPAAEFRVFRAYETEARQRPVGLAFRVWGSGFWARIDAMVALTPDRQQVLGIVFLEQRETPGLGGRIADAEFTDQFSRPARALRGAEPLRATPPDDASLKVLYIGRGSPTGPGDPRYARSVDAVTGATQTSLAVERFLNANLRRFHTAYDAGLKPIHTGRPAS